MNKIGIEDFLNYNYLSGLKTIHNRDLFSFIISNPNKEENNYKQSLYVSDDNNHRKIYEFKAGAFYKFFDAETLVVKETEDKKEHLLFININSKEVVKKVPLEHSISSLEFIDENHLIYSSYHNPNKEEYDDNLFEVIETIPFQSNGSGFTQGKFTQLFLLDLKSNKVTELTTINEDVMTFEFDENKNNLFYTSIQNTGILTFYPHLYKINLNNLEKSTLYSKEEFSISSIIPLNNKIYVTAASLLEHGINQNRDFYEVEDNNLNLVIEFGLSSYNSIGSDVRYGGSRNSQIHEQAYYFVGTYHTYNRLYKFDGNKISVIYESEGSIDGWDFANDGSLNMILLKNDQLQEIYRLDLENQSLTQISSLNKDMLKDQYIGIPKHISFVNDGQALDGWIIYPRNFKEGKRYPAILDIHGGPKTIYSDVFYHEMQHWASEGYFVFFCNPRGGDAFDNQFADIRGKYGTIDYDDIMAFTDHILDHYPIDKEKVGVTGGSYGGFMTNWIVSHTDRFAAAATQRSISNWISFYGTSDIGYYFASDQTDANPYEKLEEMWEQSPLKHAQNIDTPLLFIHSDKDYRCPIEQAMQLYTVVKEKGVDTRFVWFKDENHDLSRTGRPKGRIKRLEEITAWMNHYLK